MSLQNDLQITFHMTQNTSHGEYNLFPLHTYKSGSHFSSGTWEETEIACEYSECNSQAVAKKEVAFTSIYLPYNFPSPIIHYCFLCISSKFPNTNCMCLNLHMCLILRILLSRIFWIRKKEKDLCDYSSNDRV